MWRNLNIMGNCGGVWGICEGDWILRAIVKDFGFMWRSLGICGGIGVYVEEIQHYGQ